eukprot:TRINITY_DN37397_c0_g1_i2.p1 TRINITY_DN37397_c0_g1~~TRINITY_DN37397_c0_g1_i2.p1  ORF type:complete len:367 (+),score=49.75 TRINITY_DN37397_c0_g1_i2:291-1391(+)
MANPDEQHGPVKILTVGEGDLSFSLALQRCFGDAIVLTATTYITKEQLFARYKTAEATLCELLQGGAAVMHEIDACKLPHLDADIVVFNYPHLGDVPGDCHSPESTHVRQHRRLLSHFLHSARLRLLQQHSSEAAPGGGRHLKQRQVHVTLCGEQPTLWDLTESAASLGFAQLWPARAPSDLSAFLGEERWFLTEAAESRAKAGLTWARARRKWRSGELGCVHWASRYGYEFRRHDGEVTMNTDRSLSFVFVLSDTSPTDISPAIGHNLSDLKGYCSVCRESFSTEEALAAHLEAPAAPHEQERLHCQGCAKTFISERALAAHVASGSCKTRQGHSGYIGWFVEDAVLLQRVFVVHRSCSPPGIAR